MADKKHPKHLARCAAVQALYQWQHNPVSPMDLKEDCLLGADPATDADYAGLLIAGAIDNVEAIDALIDKRGSRPIKQLDSMDLAILRVAVYELKEQISVPYRVAVNEAIEIAKVFASPDSYKYVNAILNAMLDELRPVERSK